MHRTCILASKIIKVVMKLCKNHMLVTELFFLHKPMEKQDRMLERATHYLHAVLQHILCIKSLSSRLICFLWPIYVVLHDIVVISSKAIIQWAMYPPEPR